LSFLFFNVEALAQSNILGSICNGIAAHGGLLPFCSTFFNFCGYMLGAVRLSALSHFRVIYILTHDSIGLGEDGPTHQPVRFAYPSPHLTFLHPSIILLPMRICVVDFFCCFPL
jgi:hypothetical protein